MLIHCFKPKTLPLCTAFFVVRLLLFYLNSQFFVKSIKKKKTTATEAWLTQFSKGIKTDSFTSSFLCVGIVIIISCNNRA